MVLWVNAKRARFGKIGRIMLKHARCPHCGYDLRNLPTDPIDEATVCPECGCAWHMPQNARKEATGGDDR
jgi:predicted Zn-ribbon and HTH transcriptional regulator